MLDTISSIDFNTFNGLNITNKELCTLELTVATGLEEIAALEIKEKLSASPVHCRGRVLVDVPIDQVHKALKLRSIDHVYIIVHVKPKFLLTDDREKCFSRLYHYSTEPDWPKGLQVWQSIFKTDVGDPFINEKPLAEDFAQPRPDLDLRLMKKESPVANNLPENICSSVPQVTLENEAKSEVKETNSEEPKLTSGPKFRVSCHRVGSNHKFGSPEAARQFGAGLNERFSWPVDLKHFDLEALLNITEDFVYVSISLTKEALFKRNVTVFGPTNLRATICYNMIRLAKPEVGDIVIDPMCGGSTLPMEGALTYNSSYYMSGDHAKAAVNRSRTNIDNLEKKLPLDVMQWNCTALPLRNQVADVVITDLPFGKRMGSKVDNRVLYYKSLVELARVTKLETGRAVLLTHDRNSMNKNLARVTKLWKHFCCRTINIGGLAAGVYLLRRTALASDPNIFSPPNESKKRKLDSVSPSKDSS